MNHFYGIWTFIDGYYFMEIHYFMLIYYYFCCVIFNKGMNECVLNFVKNERIWMFYPDCHWYSDDICETTLVCFLNHHAVAFTNHRSVIIINGISLWINRFFDYKLSIANDRRCAVDLSEWYNFCWLAFWLWHFLLYYLMLSNTYRNILWLSLDIRFWTCFQEAGLFVILIVIVSSSLWKPTIPYCFDFNRSSQ